MSQLAKFQLAALSWLCSTARLRPRAARPHARASCEDERRGPLSLAAPAHLVIILIRHTACPFQLRSHSLRQVIASPLPLWFCASLACRGPSNRLRASCVCYLGEPLASVGWSPVPLPAALRSCCVCKARDDGFVILACDYLHVGCRLYLVFSVERAVWCCEL